MTAPPVAALTGGTGFVGRYAALALHGAGWRVRLLARRDPAHPLLEGVPLEVVRGELADAGALARLAAGASAVVHAAGLVKARDRAAFMRANAAGSGEVAAAAAREGARLVLVSSQAARAPRVSDYAASKRAGEEAAVAASGANPWAVLRPGMIYGEWDAASPALLRLGALPAAPVPWGREPRLTLVHARDVAALIARLCRADAPAGVRWEVADDRADGYGWRELAALCAAAQGRPPPRAWPVPDALLLAAGRLADARAALLGRPEIFGLGKAREILHRDWAPDRAALPPPDVWRPRVGAAEGLAAMAGWLRGAR